MRLGQQARPEETQERKLKTHPKARKNIRYLLQYQWLLLLENAHVLEFSLPKSPWSSLARFLPAKTECVNPSANISSSYIVFFFRWLCYRSLCWTPAAVLKEKWAAQKKKNPNSDWQFPVSYLIY